MKLSTKTKKVREQALRLDLAGLKKSLAKGVEPAQLDLCRALVAALWPEPLDANCVAIEEPDRELQELVVRTLVEHGASPDFVATDEYGSECATPLVALLQCEIPRDRKLALLELFLSHGGSVDERSDAWTPLEAALPSGDDVDLGAFEMLATRASPSTIQAALGFALRPYLAHGPGISASLATGSPSAALPRLLELTAHIDEPDWTGLTPLQTAAVAGRVDVVRSLVGRGASVDARTAKQVSVNVSVLVNRTNPQIQVPAGATALDLVTEVLAEGTRVIAGASKAHVLDRGVALLEALEAVRLVLVEAGASRAVRRDVPTQPAFKAQVDEAFGGLALALRADPRTWQKRLDAIDASGSGPWGYMSSAADALRDELPARRPETFFRLFVDRLHEGREPVVDVDIDDDDDDDRFQLDVDGYPEAAREPLRKGTIVGYSPDELFVLWPEPDRATWLCRITPDALEILAETPAALIGEAGRSIASS